MIKWFENVKNGHMVTKWLWRSIWLSKKVLQFGNLKGMVSVWADEFWRERDEQNQSDEDDKILEWKEPMKMNRFKLLQMKGIRKEQR